MPYGSTSACQAYWASKGYSGVPTDALLEAASVFVDGLGWRMTAHGVPVNRFPGQPASATQERSWPRTGATDAYGNAFDAGAVPLAIEHATYEAAHYESTKSGALNKAQRPDQRVTRKKIDVIEFQYADTQSNSASGISTTVPVIPAVMTLLAPLLSGGENPYGITGVVA